MGNQNELKLFQNLSQTILLEEILELFSKEMDSITEIDGLSVFLADEKKEKLIAEKVHFSGKFNGMEKVIYKTSYTLNNSMLYNNLMKEKKYYLVDSTNYPEQTEEIKRTYDLWEAKGILYLPFLTDDPQSSGQEPLGVVMVLSHRDKISEEMISETQKRINQFYYPVKNALIFSYLKEKEGEIDKGVERNRRILEIAHKVNSLSSLSIIYKTILEEILDIFHFDFGILFMEKNNFLEFTEAITHHPNFIAATNEIIRFFIHEAKGYALNIPDGASTISHSRNTHFYFPDVQAIVNLPMSPKDRRVIDTLKSPQTFLLMPIRRNGRPVGSVHLYTLENKINLSESDIRIIEALCSFIGSALENAELYHIVDSQKKKLEEKNKIIQAKNYQLKEELKLAQQIQQKLIPLTAPQISGIRVASLYKPMENVGGDFYDFIQIKDPQMLGVFISDVSGHGVPAALITSMVKTLIETAGKNRNSPKSLLGYINEKIIGQTSGNFLTAFYGLLDVKSKTFKYARASHHYPYLIRDGIVSELASRGKMLGINRGVYFEEKEIQLQSGDKVLFYTDGLTEAVNHENIEFEDKLSEIMTLNFKKPVEDFIQSIYLELIKHREEYNFDDDVCMIGLEVG